MARRTISAGGGRYLSDRAASTIADFANSFRFFANVESMQFTQRQRLFVSPWRPLLAALTVGLLLGFAGPFGSYPAFPTATRYAFWLGMAGVGGLAAVAADSLLPVTRLRPGPLRVAGAALISALPMTFVVAWTMSFVQPGRFFSPQQLPILFASVATVQLLVVFAATFVSRPAGGEMTSEPAQDLSQEQAEPKPAAFPAALLSRLPPHIGTRIIAIETEDHYLRVHAAGGGALILMRMADAVALLDPRLGTQVHRRWWVAEAAVAGMKTEGGKLSLRLCDDTVVPVGRTFAAAARKRFAYVRSTNAACAAEGAGEQASAGGA